MMTEKQDFQYKSLTSQDLDQVQGFFAKVYKQSLNYGSRDFFKWKIFENATATGIINGAYWNQTLVSTTSITPKSLIFKQNALQAAEIGDTYTDENFQRRGLFANLVNKSRSDAEATGIQFVYGTPNANSLPGYLKKCEFQEIRQLEVYSYTLLLSLHSLVSVKLIFIPADLVLKGLLKLFFKFFSRGSALRSFENFQAHHDELWKKVKHQYDFIFSKSGSTLNWRFSQNPYGYKMFDIYYQDKFCGYIISRPSDDGKILYIAEALSIPGKETGFAKGLGQFILSHIGKYERINAWSSIKDPLTKYFRKSFFIKRNNVTVITYKSAFTKSIANIETCHFSLADSDNI